MFTGEIAGHGTRAMCPIQDGGKGVLFTVLNQDGSPRTMNRDFCTALFQALIEACDHGGEDSRDGWLLRYVLNDSHRNRMLGMKPALIHTCHSVDPGNC